MHCQHQQKNILIELNSIIFAELCTNTYRYRFISCLSTSNIGMFCLVLYISIHVQSLEQYRKAKSNIANMAIGNIAKSIREITCRKSRTNLGTWQSNQIQSSKHLGYWKAVQSRAKIVLPTFIWYLSVLRGSLPWKDLHANLSM